MSILIGTPPPMSVDAISTAGALTRLGTGYAAPPRILRMPLPTFCDIQ